MWRFLLKGAASVLLIWLLLRGRDLGALAHQMLAVDRGALALAAATLWLLAVPNAVRWSMVLRFMGHPVRFRTSFPLVLIGLFFNLTLPSSVGGDAVRMWQLHRAGLPPAVAIVSVMVDRLVALAAILVMVLAVFPLMVATIPDRAAQGGVLLLLGLGFLAFALAMMLDRLPFSLRRYRVVRGIAQLSAQLRNVLLVPHHAAPTLLLSLVTQVGAVAAVRLLVAGLGLPIGWLECLLVVPLVNLATVAPISVAGWGVREGAFVAALGFFGVPAADALALSVLYGLLGTLVALPGGLVWLAMGSARAAAGPREDEEVAPAAKAMTAAPAAGRNGGADA